MNQDNVSIRSRLLPLDGLRGFAALSVVISHLGINIESIVASPVANFFFRMISSGTTAVQLFFVLSGFLMAYLYPVVSSSFDFLSKRYLRIMPLYGTIVIFIWWNQFHSYDNFWKNSSALLILSLLVHVIWRCLSFLKKGKLIFILFLLFQLVYFIFSLTLMPDLVSQSAVNLNNFQKDILYMLSNLSMTMYLQKRLIVLSGVFWSLVPEMIFYLIYPFIVVPVVSRLNPQKPWLVLVVCLAVIKALFDLDAVSGSFYSVHGIFISRMSGFIIGLIIGRIYLNQGRLWHKLETFLSRPLINLTVLAIFLTALGLELPDRYYQIREYVAFHFLGLSLIFGLTVMAALAAKSWLGRLFSQRFLVFLGMISFSLYLIHPFVISQISEFAFWGKLSSQLTIGWFNLVKILIVGGLCVGVAGMLYWLIERLNFTSKQPKLNLVESVKPEHLWQKTILPTLVAAIAIIWIYSGDYSPSLIMARHSLTNLAGQADKFEFKAKEANLSVVLLSLDYVRDPEVKRNEDGENTQLVFTLLDHDNQILFVSTRSAQKVEGQPQFPFGFPSLADSKGKKYFVKISLINAGLSDEIHINKSLGMVTQYLTEKNLSPKYLTNLIYHRLIFVLSYPQAWLALALIIFYFTSQTSSSGPKSF